MNDDSLKTQLPSPNPSAVSHQSSASPIDSTSASASVAPVSDRRQLQLINADGLHKYSCVVCATRKIKCDRRDPCGNCAKANSQCIYRAPPPPRRRKKGVAAQSTVLERLKRAEDMLATQQTGPNAINNMMWRLSDMQLEKRGHLINHNNSTRYLDNSMWIWLDEELRDIRSAIEDEVVEEDATPVESSPAEEDHAGSMLFATSPRATTLFDQHPSPVHIFQLWQLYLQNVHPIIKVLHSPTAQQDIIDATSHLDNISRPLECLLFSIYFLVTTSITEDECDERFQESKASMISRYRHATQVALLRADYLTSYSLTVLQAYLIYLIALRSFTTPAAMWALSGVAIRMAHRMGLHRDGAALGLPVFDVEIRRRIWWEIMFFDSRTAQLSGTGGISLSKGVEHKQPSNVNDSELYPGMKTPPVEHEGVTEMIHAMLKAEIGNFLISFPHQSGTFDGSWQGVTHSGTAAADKDKLIDEFEIRLDQKFISKCDPSIPQHLLATSITRSVLNNIRFMAHNPRQAARGGTVDPKEEQFLLDHACKILEQTIYIQKEPGLKRFAFYTRMHFQYLAMAYLLRMLRTYTKDVVAERGWSIVHGIHELDPPILLEAPKTLYKAICDLTLSAWYARATANPGIMTPAYIEELKVSRGVRSDQLPEPVMKEESSIPQGVQMSNQGAPVAGPGSFPYTQAVDTGVGTMPDPQILQQSAMAMQPDAMDWEDWDRLLQVGGLSSIDFSTVEQDFFNTAQPVDMTVPTDFSAWNNSGHFG